MAHPRFSEQLERLMVSVESQQKREGNSKSMFDSAKLLRAMLYLIHDVIPQDPTRAEYRQGNTLGPEYRHWFRAKFGNGRFRLFFRYNTKMKIIIYAWVNDNQTLRTYSAKTDAYAVFKRMLSDDNPPDDWQALLKASHILSTKN